MDRLTSIAPRFVMAVALGLALALTPLLPGSAWAQEGDDDAILPEDDPAAIEELSEEELDALFFNDGITRDQADWDEAGIPAEADGMLFWGVRGEEGSWDALIFDIITDDAPPEVELHSWDRPFGDDFGMEEAGPPTSEEIQAKLMDEQYSPLNQVLTQGPVEGVEVPIFVLVPDSVLASTATTSGIPNAATYKAMRLADQLTNGISFSFDRRTDTIALQPSPQTLVPQLEFRDVEVYQGVVKFLFNVGIDPAAHYQAQRATSYEGEGEAPAASIADGFDQALDAALKQAIRKAVVASVRGGSGGAVPDTITGRVTWYEITNEGYLAESEEFLVEVDAHIEISHGGNPSEIDPNGLRSSATTPVEELGQ